MNVKPSSLRSLAMGLAAFLSFGAVAAEVPASKGAPGKGGARVESRVHEQIAAQGQSTFWVVLREQADLKPAFKIPDWQARGHFVYNRLLTVANRTQPGLRGLLQQRGANFKPVWIVNALQVTGDQDTLDEMAAQPQVKEILATGTYSVPQPIVGIPQARVNGVEWNIDRINAPLVPWETLRLCRRDSRSLTVPGARVAGKVWWRPEQDEGLGLEARPGERAGSRNELHCMDRWTHEDWSSQWLRRAIIARRAMRL